MKTTSNPSETVIWFGKHRGKSLRDVPRQYLEWCLKERAGGGELVGDIAAFLGAQVEPQKRPYEGVTINPAELEELASKLGYTAVNAFCEGLDTIGVANVSEMFDPTIDWPGTQEWDGETAPWLDQSTEVDGEFRAMFEGL